MPHQPIASIVSWTQRLTTGHVRLPNGTVVKDPDDQVRHVLELVFAKFEELGSVNKVLRYLRQQKILLPRRQNAGPRPTNCSGRSLARRP